MRGLLLLLAALAGPGAGAAAEPWARVDWDQAGLRTAAAAWLPAAAWGDAAGRAAAASRDAQLALLPRLLPGLPDPRALWEGIAGGSVAWEAGGAALRIRAGDLAPGLAGGLAAWLGPGWALRAQAGEVAGGSGVPPPAPPSAALPAGAAVDARLDLPSVLARLAAEPAAARRLRRWSRGDPADAGVLRVQLAASGTALLAAGGGWAPLLHRPDRALVRGVPARAGMLALGCDPAALAAELEDAGPAPVRLLMRLLGSTPAALARAFTGDAALVWDERRPRPRFALALARRPGGDPAGMFDHLGDAVAGRSRDLAGAQRAWTVASPLGALTLALDPRLLLVGDDEAAMEALLAGVPGPWAEADGDLLLRAAPAALASVLDPVLRAWRWRPLADPLPGLLAELHDPAWGLAQDGLRQEALAAALLTPGREVGLRLPGGVRQRFAPAPGLADRLAAHAGAPAAEALRGALGLWLDADGGRLLAAARGAGGTWWVADDSRPAEPVDAAGLARRCAGMVAVLGVGDGAALRPSALPPAPVADRTCLPPPTAAILPAYQLVATTGSGGWHAEESGLPLLAGAILGSIPALADRPVPAPVRDPAPTADL